MKYLLLFLCMVVIKYIFNREGLYNKNNIMVNNGKPDVSSLTNESPKKEILVDKVNENILDNQYSMININNIRLF